MTGLTPKGYVYPQGGDLVRDGDDTVHALALQVDKRHHIGGTFNLAAIGAGASHAPTAVTFPVGSFTVPPTVVCSSGSSRLSTGPSNVVATGFTFNASNWSPAGSPATPAFWVAISNETI